ncbi:MAG TPA: PQQ-binding-like beta-propeller repeat protein [Anaerolineae bacterium]|nr:PQQ-binding-like beta-propeller repeat protein [Anaerolineae bacterium]HQK13427.1 PQQ-binding-like beta-propeller repeat protein [Anaerolineae bacterium]
MGDQKPESKQDEITPAGFETRRMRGLSQRLRQPLSPEPSLATTVVSPAPAAESGATKIQHPPGAGETREVAPKPQISSEGLLPAGAQLQGRYKILGVIGIGGMGAVYKAQDLRFPGVLRLCAVKEMINTATDPQMRQMIVRNFEREASILATLSHPAIPQVYDYFTEGSRCYLVEEFVSGKDLEARLAETEGFFPESQVVDWAIQLCEVLSYLHNHKPRPIIFRDLKPSNIMLDDHDRIRLVDFGIAKLFQSGEKGTMIGTEGYSPPEQYRGIAEPRGDIYALGATLHHLLSKQDPRLEPPFSFHERPIHRTNPTVSRELVEAIDKALEYDINKRWGSAEEFRRALIVGAPTKAGSIQGETAAFESNAVKPVWKFACEDEVRGSVTVAVDEDMVLVPSYDHNIYALDRETGKFKWKYPTEAGIVSKPWVSEGMVVFGSIDKVVYAVDVKTGRLLWTTPTQGRIYSSPYGELGHIFIGSDDRQIYAIHQMSGRRAWTYAADGEIRSRPLVAENLILFACQMGVVYALSLNRELRWRFRARRGFLAAPVMANGLIFIGSLDTNFYAVDVRSGWAAWKYRTGGSIVSTAAVWKGMVFFGSVDGFIYALDADEGRVVWRHQTENQVTGGASVYEGNLYIGGVDGILYCFDALSGKVRWHYQTDGPITGTPEVAEGIIYVGSADHYVYAFPA